MAKWLMLTLVILVGVQAPVGAQDWAAPVEVHMDTGDALHMYDCWPIGADWPPSGEGTPSYPTMLVYVTYADNLIIGYECEYGEGAWRPPFAPYSTTPISVKSEQHF